MIVSGSLPDPSCGSNGTRLRGLAAPSLVLHEMWDAETARRILRVPGRAECKDEKLLYSLQTICRVLEESPGSGGVCCVTRKYRHSPSFSVGRLYAAHSLQGVCGAVRRACSWQYYWDLDITNCFPTILLRLAKSKGAGGLPLLEQYVASREEVLGRIQGEYGVDRDSAKTAVLAVLHEGSVPRRPGGGAGWLSGFRENVVLACRVLSGSDEFAWIWDKVMRREDKRRKRGSFLSWVCQMYECRLILAAREYLEEKGMKVGVLTFDGLMVERPRGGSDDPFPEGVLEGLGEHCERECGVRVSFCEKGLRPTEADLAKLGLRGHDL